MTQSLQRAIAKLEQLPADTQDALAARILADLEDEQAWEMRFDSTSAEQWERLVNGAQREIAAGETTPLQDVFPDRVTED
jgi:hypothetical protein